MLLCGSVVRSMHATAPATADTITVVPSAFIVFHTPMICSVCSVRAPPAASVVSAFLPVTGIFMPLRHFRLISILLPAMRFLIVFTQHNVCVFVSAAVACMLAMFIPMQLAPFIMRLVASHIHAMMISLCIIISLAGCCIPMIQRLPFCWMACCCCISTCHLLSYSVMCYSVVCYSLVCYSLVLHNLVVAVVYQLVFPFHGFQGGCTGSHHLPFRHNVVDTHTLLPLLLLITVVHVVLLLASVVNRMMWLNV